MNAIRLLAAARRALPPATTLAALVLVAAARSAHAGEPIVATDLLKIRSVASIDVALDGTKAVLAVRSIGEVGGAEAAEPGADGAPVEPIARNQSHLYLLDLVDADAAPRRLTHGDRVDRSPRFSPDGRRIAFVRGRSDEEEGGGPSSGAPPQVWILPVDGGEAWRATGLPLGASAPAWSPDGTRLLVTSTVPADELDAPPAWSSERPGRTWRDAEPGAAVTPRPDGTREEIRAWLAGNAAGRDPVVITRLAFQDEQALRGPLEFRHLFLVDPDRPEADAIRVTSGARDHNDGVFMPDGRSILFTARPITVHPDRTLVRSIWRLSLEGGAPEALVAPEGWTLRAPRPRRDGTAIAFLGERTDEPAYRLQRLGVASLAPDGPPVVTWLTDADTFDAPAWSYAWMSSRSTIVLTSEMHGGFPLMSIDRGLIEPAPLVDEADGLPVGVQAFGVGAGAIVYAMTSAANPCVVRVRDARGDRLAFDLNEWTREKDLSRPEPGRISRPDGTQVEFWVMKPTRLDSSATYPLALEIHGGPSAMWGPGEFTMWLEFQLLCSWGYGVVYSNPRGSGGYGYDFQRANFQNWGDGPAGDVLAVVDQVLLEEWVDRERLVMTGGSYGGYLTAWIVAHDHRFKAAVAQRGVYDLATFFGEGNAWRLVEWAMGGFPWDPRVGRVLQRESPFSAVNRIRTPLLILHASRDLRTCVSQSEMLYRALKELGRPWEYVRYPGVGHELSRSGDPHQRLDRLNRILEFFERHIENPRAAPRPTRAPAPAAAAVDP
jgi:dipeptidyl aminopeptidase/acylaminoacyl peptidase